MYTEGDPQLLPEALRQAVRAALSGQVLHCCDDVADHISRGRRRRDAGVRASLAAVASGFTFSTAQLTAILNCLSYSPRNQVQSLSLPTVQQRARPRPGAREDAGPVQMPTAVSCHGG